MELYMNGIKLCNFDDVVKIFEPPEEDSRVQFPITFSNNRSATFICKTTHIDKERLLDIFRPFRKIKGRGPKRRRMRRRAELLRTNFIESFTFTKEGDEYVDERGAFRLVLQ